MIFTERSCGSIASWMSRHLMPACTRTTRFAASSDSTLFMPAHVEMQRAGLGDLSALAEAPAADRNRAGPGAQRSLDFLGRARAPHVGHLYRIKLRDVVDHRLAGPCGRGQ